jgi:hypothetical protein
MKKRSIVTSALLGAVTLLTLHSTKAALSYTPGDLFLGFRAQGGTGASKDYVVNIGQFSLYTSGASFTVGNYGSDLSSSSLFGSSWNTNRGEGNNVFWGVIGTPFNNDGDARTIYVSEPSSSSTVFTGRSPNTSLGTINLIQSVGNGYLNNNGTVSATNPAALTQNVGDQNSWASFYQGNLDFNRFDETEGNFILGTSSADAKLNLYQINPINGQDPTLLGSFTINDSGVVTFTAVPEPSTWLLMGTALSALVLFKSRRRIITNA